MERTVWSDERIDDRFSSIDRRLDRIEDELVALRRDFTAETGSLRGELASLRRDMHVGFMAQTTGLLALAAAVVAHSL